MHLGWVVCSSPDSRSTKVSATVGVLAALSLSCLRPSAVRRGRGHPASRRPVCQALAREEPVDWYCLALPEAS
ncbi:hypothetical protein CesoFtcFv8_018738 [Champsocephalus esox]|uniref:Uncharacterized protein n=2 Tax=Champsocephalus TaxID=52236 RepID=A0AAN8HF85_CHAGU|nr:hypothetical protein CesoFtcFv8_018738 [Champsocephalus esox]KAK5914044.1 hypothetical protein CgunFtcFv8_008511 [Champsocephalus gunnari]